MATRIFQDKHAIESLRESDFDTLSAYGEVIDNSIQANAKNIKIKFLIDGTNFKQVAFGDDGDGMDSETLEHCAQIGWSSRYGNRDGIGRFGVGMTMAMIHECRRMEIYSKNSSGNWLNVYVDLDEIKEEGAEIQPPKPKSLPDEYRGLTGETGTIVIWSKYDRQRDPAHKIIDEFKVWAGRTYRYYIWDENVNIFINGTEVKAIDPLYLRTDKTNFPEDITANAYDDITVPWPVNDSDGKSSEITIKTSLLPEEWRKKQGDGGSRANKERYVHMNNGISILRNKREVFYGEIPYWSVGNTGGWAKFEDIDRWFGCEIHFHAELDRAFEVKNIKRGAVPNKPLKKMIKQQITPTRMSALEEVRRVWDATKLEKKKEEDSRGNTDPLGRPKHIIDAEKIAKDTPGPKDELDKNKDFEKERDEYIERNKDNIKEQEIAALNILFTSQPFTIRERTWKGPSFVETTYMGGQTVMEYNLQHAFFVEVYAIINSLEDNNDINHDAARKLKSLIDLLLIAHAKAELSFSPDSQLKPEEFVDFLRSNWGQHLQSYIRSWKADE